MAGVAAIAGAALLLVSCSGGDSDSDETPTATATSTATATAGSSTPAATTPAPTATAAPGGGDVSLVAGSAAAGDHTAGEDGPAEQAVLNLADDVAVAPKDDIYIADSNSFRILKLLSGGRFLWRIAGVAQ